MAVMKTVQQIIDEHEGKDGPDTILNLAARIFTLEKEKLERNEDLKNGLRELARKWGLTL